MSTPYSLRRPRLQVRPTFLHSRIAPQTNFPGICSRHAQVRGEPILIMHASVGVLVPRRTRRISVDCAASIVRAASCDGRGAPAARVAVATARSCRRLRWQRRHGFGLSVRPVVRSSVRPVESRVHVMALVGAGADTAEARVLNLAGQSRSRARAVGKTLAASGANAAKAPALSAAGNSGWRARRAQGPAILRAGVPVSAQGGHAQGPCAQCSGALGAAGQRWGRRRTAQCGRGTRKIPICAHLRALAMTLSSEDGILRPRESGASGMAGRASADLGKCNTFESADYALSSKNKLRSLDRSSKQCRNMLYAMWCGGVVVHFGVMSSAVV